MTKIGRLLLIIQATLIAGEVRFIASVDRTEVGLGEPVLLTVVVEGQDLGQVPYPKLPDLPDFDVGGTSTSQSTSIQMAGGKSVKRQLINFIYTLFPRSVGEKVIGPCTMEFGGEKYMTDPIIINVLKSGTSPAPKGALQAPPLSMAGEASDQDLKLSVTADRVSVFQGEQILVEYVLYTRLRLADISLDEMPSFKGSWVEPVFDAQRIEFKRTTVDNKQYDYCLLKKAALFPVTSGQLRISPMKLNVAVVQAPRDFFDFFGTTKTVALESKPLLINIIPLPVEGKPDDFSGGVGQFSITASLDRASSEAGEPINLTVRVTGTGNVKLVEKPLIPDIPGVKILDPEINENVSFTAGRIQGYKEFSYPVVPQTDGEHIIAAIRMSFFDPGKRAYVTIETGKLKFTATQTAAAVELAQTGSLKISGTDIRHIKPDAERLVVQRMSVGWWLVFPFVGSLVLIASSSLYRRHRSRLLSDRAYARKVRSSRMLRRRLDEARYYLKKEKVKEFHAALSRVLLGYIGDRYNLEVGTLTHENMIQILRDKKIDAEAISELEYLLHQCDTRFSQEMKCDEPRLLYERARHLIGRL